MSIYRHVLRVVFVALLLLSAACAPQLPATGSEPSVPTATTGPAVTVTRDAIRPIKPLETISPTQPALVVGEVPDDLLNSVIDDLAHRTGIDRQSIEVVGAQAVVWNDGSLGCAKPGEMYTQAPVDGYRVILRADSKNYDYRLSDTGFFFLCEQTLPQK